jgi:hypothetical protein
MEIIFEKQGIINLLKNIQEILCGIRLHIIVPCTCSLKKISKFFQQNSKFLAENNFSNFAQNDTVMETHHHVMETHQ